jgi:Holliday junction resolvasome RuvABC DNA-binding subunit
MAEKIILELKDKDFWILLPKHIANEHHLSSSLSALIKESLTNMWYDPKEIDKRLAHLPKEFTQAKDIIPYMIRELS